MTLAVRLAAIGALVCAAVAGVGVGNAAAGPYLGGLTVSNTSPAPGAQVTVRVAGVTPNQPTQLAIDDTRLANPTADANGVATSTVTIPSTTSTGEHLLLVTRRSARGARDHAVLFSQALDVQTGGDAFSRSDGGGPSALIVAALVVGATIGAVVLRRRVRPAR